MLSIHDPEAYSEIYTTESRRKTSNHQPFSQGLGFDGDFDLFWPQGGDSQAHVWQARIF